MGSSRALQPGLIFDLLHRPHGEDDPRVVTIDVPNQEIMTRDNVLATVDAVVYFRVVDPLKRRW